MEPTILKEEKQPFKPILVMLFFFSYKFHFQFHAFDYNIFRFFLSYLLNVIFSSS